VIGWVAFAVFFAWALIGVLSLDFAAVTGESSARAQAFFVGESLNLLAFPGIGALCLSLEPENRAVLLCLSPVLSPPRGLCATATWTGQPASTGWGSLDPSGWVATWTVWFSWATLSEGVVALLRPVPPTGGCRIADSLPWRCWSLADDLGCCCQISTELGGGTRVRAFLPTRMPDPVTGDGSVKKSVR
jgi:hypothetical protein